MLYINEVRLNKKLGKVREMKRMKHTDNEAELYSRARSQAISTPNVLIDLMKGVGDFGGLTGAHFICCDGRELHPHVTLRSSL